MPAAAARDGGLSISIVVPVYNSSLTLPELVARLESVLARTASTFEVILVNDGSTDGSMAVIEGLTREHPTVRGIDLMRNYGQHNALLCGIRTARHELTVTIDDDLQRREPACPVAEDISARLVRLPFYTDNN